MAAKIVKKVLLAKFALRLLLAFFYLKVTSCFSEISFFCCWHLWNKMLNKSPGELKETTGGCKRQNYPPIPLYADLISDQSESSSCLIMLEKLYQTVDWLHCQYKMSAVPNHEACEHLLCVWKHYHLEATVLWWFCLQTQHRPQNCLIRCLVPEFHQMTLVTTANRFLRPKTLCWLFLYNRHFV